MPHTASAAKRLRQNEKRRLLNKARVSELHTISKKLQRALHDGKADEAKGLYQTLTKRLDQAASCKVIHPNAAARTKARVAVRIAATAKAPAKA